jgi:hypothetical protein
MLKNILLLHLFCRLSDKLKYTHIDNNNIIFIDFDHYCPKILSLLLCNVYNYTEIQIGPSTGAGLGVIVGSVLGVLALVATAVTIVILVILCSKKKGIMILRNIIPPGCILVAMHAYYTMS